MVWLVELDGWGPARVVQVHAAGLIDIPAACACEDCGEGSLCRVSCCACLSPHLGSPCATSSCCFPLPLLPLLACPACLTSLCIPGFHCHVAKAPCSSKGKQPVSLLGVSLTTRQGEGYLLLLCLYCHCKAPALLYHLCLSCLLLERPCPPALPSQHTPVCPPAGAPARGPAASSQEACRVDIQVGSWW
jgi:hypothetical protein